MEHSKTETKDFSKKWFKGRNLVIVTNREPYAHSHTEDGEIVCSIPTGGVTAAMDPVMQEMGGTWVAWGSGGADKDVVDSRSRVKVPPITPGYTLKRVWLSGTEVDNYYSGYCNEGLWPLAHNLVSKVRFDNYKWKAYVRVNRKFAKAVLEEAGDRDVVWVHDYHLMLLPEMLKKEKPGLTVVFFWHIPWPQHDIFKICPDHKSLLRGICASDLVGFHIPRYCRNFQECLERAFTREQIWSAAMPRVEPFPISTDVRDIERGARTARVKKFMKQLRDKYRLEGRIVGCGVERMDYTKGIPERLEALEILFDKHPDLQGKFTFLQVCSPSRGEISEYKAIKTRVVELTNRINSRFGSEDWTPVVVFHRKVPFEHILAMYRMADLAVVSPLVDGMNLVAKEFIAAQVDEKGVLVLSEFAGAAGSIKNAIPCNPFERDSFADSIYHAVTMPPDEKTAMIRAARDEAGSYTVFDWVNGFLKAASEIAAVKSAGLEV
jgi:trehalose 6-phosphate synthase